MRNLIVSLFLAATALSARAANDSLQIGNVTWTGSPGGYNCFTNAAYPNTVNFTITTPAGAQTYAVTAGPSANTGSYRRQLASGPDQLNYQLYTTSALNFVFKAPPTATANEVIIGASNARVSTVIPLAFTFYIPPSQLVAPGAYTDQVTVRIYERYNDTGAALDSRTITLTAMVVPAAILSVVPTGSGFSSSTSQNLNFGTLSAGQSLGCDLLVRKNTSCKITFSSLNGGVMKLIPKPTADKVTYSCSVNQTVLDLASPAQISLPSGVSPSQDGDRLPINFTIGDPSRAAAGDYQDQITITVLAL